MQRKFELILTYTKAKKIPVSGVHLVGGVSCNSALREMIEVSSAKYGLDVLTCPLDICVDNGAMIAWNGWELKNANQDVDIRDMQISGHRKVPLGNYMTEHLFKIKESQMSYKVK